MASKRGRMFRDGTLIGTPVIPWVEIRASAAEDEADAIDSGETAGDFMDYDLNTRSSSVFDLQAAFGNSFSQLLLCFYGEDGGGQTVVPGTDAFGFQLFGYRQSISSTLYGPPLLIAQADSGSAVTGDMQVAHDANGTAVTAGEAYWVDTIALSFSDWMGGVEVFDSGNNRIAILRVADLMGCRYIDPIIFNADGATASECPAVAVLGTVL